jgi:hypothetical protein
VRSEGLATSAAGNRLIQMDVWMSERAITGRTVTLINQK